MSSDAELLAAYLSCSSEAAFAELVERHVDLVYSVALRHLNGDETLAEDVAQAVFIALAGKAKTLANHPSLAGWLYSSARFAALDTVRSEYRRRLREEEVAQMNIDDFSATPELAWERLHWVVEQALDELGDSDRDAIVLRFFEARNLKSVGAALGTSEDTARKRVERALEKLRASLERHGIRSTAAALSAALVYATVNKAPEGLATSIAGAVAKSLSASATRIVCKMTTTSKISIAACTVILAIIGVSVFQLQSSRNGPPSDVGRRNTPFSSVAGRTRSRPPRLKVAVLDEDRALLSSPKLPAFEEERRTWGHSLEEEDAKLRNDTSLSDEERDQRVSMFRSKAMHEVEGRKQQMRNEILADIVKATARVAEEQGWTVVLEKGSLAKGTRKVVFAVDKTALGRQDSRIADLEREPDNLPDITADVQETLAAKKAVSVSR